MGRVRKAARWLSNNIGAALVALGVEKIFGLVGGAAVLAIVFRTLAKLRGLPLDWYLTTAVFVGGLLLIFMAIVLSRRKTRKVDSPGPKPTVEGSVNFTDCPDTWLHRIATTEAESIHSSVRILDCTLLYKEMDSAAPWVNFNFHILNLSVYSLCIDKSVDGWVNFAGRRLGGHLRRTDNFGSLGSKQSGYVVISQWLSKEDVALIKTAGEQCAFSFEHLEIWIKGDERFAEDRKVIKQKLEIACKIERVGMGVMDSDPRIVIAERDALKSRLDEIVNRPKLTGFFQEASANYYYDEFRRSGELSAVF